MYCTCITRSAHMHTSPPQARLPVWPQEPLDELELLPCCVVFSLRSYPLLSAAMQLPYMLLYLLVLALARPGHQALANPSPLAWFTFVVKYSTTFAAMATSAVPSLP